MGHEQQQDFRQQWRRCPRLNLLKISTHLTRKAFDIRPVTEDAEAIKNYIRTLPGLSTFLDKEAGVTRWHAQF